MKSLILNLRNCWESHLCPRPIPSPGQKQCAKHCWLTTIHEALPSLISRRTLACGSCIPLPKTVQVLGWEADPIPSWARAGLDWFMGTWAHGQIYGTEIQSKVCQKIWGKFFLTPLKLLPESVLYLSLSWMWVVDGMAGVFSIQYICLEESQARRTPGIRAGT